MASAAYTAKIEHSEKTIEQLYRARYHNYEKGRMAVRFIIAVAAIFAAAFADMHIALKGILLLIGAWFLVGMDFPAAMQADEALEKRKAELPVMKYEFHPDRVSVSGEGSMTITYKKFKKIAYDRDFLYLFVNANSICMVDRSTIRPKDDDLGLMKFISEKTGLLWQQEKSMIFFNLYDLKEMFSDRKKKK